jgi:MFS family permease
VSELLTAAADALNVPETLVQRSAAARATANGTSVDDVLNAWAGGAPAAGAAPSAAPSQTEEAAPTADESTEPAPSPVAEPEPEPEPATQPDVAPVAAAVVVEPEPEVIVEPVSLRRRVRTAVRVGAWTGAGLGLIGFVVASNWWAATSTVTGEESFIPVIQVDSNGVIIGAALISVVFGAVIASLSRAAASWANPGMQLSNSPSSTAWVGALIGILLGVVAGAVLTGLGTPVEGAEGVVQLPVLATIGVMAIGGAILGGLTATVTQAIGVPVAVPDGSGEEIDSVRQRLGFAFGIPLTGLLLLGLLVLPFAWVLIESNHLAEGGAAIVGILVAAGILGFASLAGTRPNIKLSFGEVMVAVIGIGTILVFILAVMFARSPDEEAEEPAAEPEAAITLVLG